MEPVREYTNLRFDEIQIGAAAVLTVTMTQNQVDVAALVAGDVDAFYVKSDVAEDIRHETRITDAAGADAIVSIVLGTRIPVVLTSRADSLRTRLASAAVMSRVAQAIRSGTYETR